MPSLFGPFQVRVDPWEVDYGSETPLEQLGERPDEEVRVDVEVPEEAWKPLTPGPAKAPERLLFVDGVRRLEARLVVRRNGQLLHGGFGSYAVGCVEVHLGQASFGNQERGHEVVLGSNQRLPHDVAVRPDLIYAAKSTGEAEPDAPLRAIQANMRSAEGDLARRLADQPDTLVVADGPLSFERPGRGAAVGFIKRITQPYVPPACFAMLMEMPPRTRSPLFAIHSRRRGFARLAWFVRLAAPRVGESELHGLVRLEVAEPLGIDAARLLADLTAALLPRYAPERGRDPRSPQNLLPIGALEHRLRHSLGNPRLVRRWIETLVVRESANA